MSDGCTELTCPQHGEANRKRHEGWTDYLRANRERIHDETEETIRTMSSLPWDQPDADPVADLRAAKEAAPADHARMLYEAYGTQGEWLCPAPLGPENCWTPLPCATHKVDSWLLGLAMYGQAFERHEATS